MCLQGLGVAQREMYLLLVVEEFIIAEAWSSDYLL